MFWKKKAKETDLSKWWTEKRFLTHLPLIDHFIWAKYGKDAEKISPEQLKKDVENLLSQLDAQKPKPKPKPKHK